MIKLIKIASNKAFTITETIVVIAILAITTTAASASVMNYNERVQLEQEAATFKNNLVFTQQQATSGEKDEACGPQELAGWCVRPDGVDQNLYHIYGSCGESPAVGLPSPQPTLFPQPPQTITLPDAITVVGWNCTGPNNGDCTTTEATGAVLFEALGNGAFFGGEGEVSADIGGSLTRVVYCFHSSAPSILVNNIYMLEVLESGEIIDHGIQTQCP